MKRFILTVPIQPEGSLKELHYSCEEDNVLLKTDRETCFPIIIPISNSVKTGEHIKVTVVLIDRPTVPANYERFKEELNAVASEIGFTYEISELKMPDKEDTVTHITLFKDMARLFVSNKDEELYACITYGTKPMPIIMLMALTYAYKLGDDFTIESIVYGSYNHTTHISTIYDVSSLFYLNSAVNNMAGLDLVDPLKLIDEFTL